MYMPANNGGDFTPPPAGTHLSVCYRVIDLGTQQVDWQGESKQQHKLMLSWEIPEEKMDDGRPFTISQRYTFSSHEKSRFRQDLEAWRGAKFTEADLAGPPNGFHVRKLLGVPCLLTIVHNVKQGKTYANISTVTKIMKGMQAPPLVNERVYLSLDPAEFNQETFDKLSSGLRAIIEKSPEYLEIKRPRGEPVHAAPPPRHHDDMDSEIPF
jgi:hypothetical protein